MIYEQIESECLEFHRKDNKEKGGNMNYVCFDCVDKACDLTAEQIFKKLPTLLEKALMENEMLVKAQFRNGYGQNFVNVDTLIFVIKDISFKNSW